MAQMPTGASWCAAAPCPSHSPALLRGARPVAHALVGPELGQDEGAGDEGVGRLARVAEEARQQQREHALVQVARERVVVARGHLGLAREREEQRGAAADDAVGVARQREDALKLEHRLEARLGRAVVDLRQQREHGAELGVERVDERRRRRRGVVARDERGPEEQRAQRHRRPARARRRSFGVEAFRTKDVRATHTLVIDHLNSVRRRVPGMADAQAVLVLESNLAFEAQHILHALNLANIQKWVALSEGQAGTLGWLTTVRAPFPGAPRVASPTHRAHRRRTE